MATLTRSDVYGAASSAGVALIGSPAGSAVQATGPNPSSVTGGGQAGATPIVGAAGQGAAFTWLGFALALLLLRITIEAGGRVETP